MGISCSLEASWLIFCLFPDDLSTAGLPIEEERPMQLARMRAKYLHFADNRRPPFYGTWRKKSQAVTARRPLAHDKVGNLKVIQFSGSF